MSRRAPKAACCDGKHVYRSMLFAKRIARKIRRDRDVPVCAYRCPHCHKIHIGGTP